MIDNYNKKVDNSFTFLLFLILLLLLFVESNGREIKKMIFNFSLVIIKLVPYT